MIITFSNEHAIRTLSRKMEYLYICCSRLSEELDKDKLQLAKDTEIMLEAKEEHLGTVRERSIGSFWDDLIHQLII